MSIRIQPLKPAAWGVLKRTGHIVYSADNAASLWPDILKYGVLAAYQKWAAAVVMNFTGGKKAPLLMIHYPYGQFLVGGCIRGDAPKLLWRMGLRQALDQWAQTADWLKANVCDSLVHYLGDFFGYPQVDSLLNADGSPTDAWFDYCESCAMYSIQAGAILAMDSLGHQPPFSPSYQLALRLLDRGVAIIGEPSPNPGDGAHVNGLPMISNFEDFHKNGADADFFARPENFSAYQIRYFNNSVDKDENDQPLAAGVDKKARAISRIQEVIDMGNTPLFSLDWPNGGGAGRQGVADVGVKLTDLKFKN